MTEKQWLQAKHPITLWYCRHARDPRKRRLAACACARRLLSIVDHDPRPVALVEAVERYADSPRKYASANWQAVLAARRAVRVWHSGPWPANTPMRVSDSLTAISRSSDSEPSRLIEMFDYARHAARGRHFSPGVSESAAQAALLRDIFGNPYRPVTFSPSWRTDTSVALAKGMYDSRDFGAMPILADSLQDAGCDSDDVLDHCRDAKQVHVRGCWVVDLVLGKV